MLKERVLTAVVGGALLVALLWAGGAATLAVVALIAGFGAFEVARMAYPDRRAAQIATGAVGAVLAVALAEARAPLFALAALGALYGATSRSRGAAPVVLFWVLYFPYGISQVASVRHGEDGFATVMAAFVALWVHDSISYFGGLAFGRRKLAPRVSPNKTVEGALAGIAAGTAVFACGSSAVLGSGGAMAVVGGVLFSLAALAGDLVESRVKRRFGVKDAGGVLPGHGGMLDRFDSAALAFPVYSVYLAILRGALT